MNLETDFPPAEPPDDDAALWYPKRKTQSRLLDLESLR